MSDILFDCPLCSAEIEAPFSMSGGSEQCPNCGSMIVIPILGINKGMTIGSFQLDHKLGVGGMGEVWLAHQKRMQREVALKILSPALVNDKDFVERFTQEVRIVSKLDHPNIVTAFDAGTDKGIHYLAISYVDGVELGDRLKIDKIIPEKEALKITLEIANALRYAWDEFKILHRDIKPSNIMLDKKGTAKLMDMGISKSVSDDLQLTMTGMIMGTPYYMSPEQALAKSNLDFRADLYSLGATLFHMTTGVVPYEADTAVAILTKHITEPLPLPKEINADISGPCSTLLEVMLAKNKQDRHSSWDDAIRDIELAMQGKYPEAPTPDVTAEFTETRTFDKSFMPKYEERLQRFKSFKPRIIGFCSSGKKAESVMHKNDKLDEARLEDHNKTRILEAVSSRSPHHVSAEAVSQDSALSDKRRRQIWLIALPAFVIMVLFIILIGVFLAKKFEEAQEEIKGIHTNSVIFKLKKKARALLKEKKYKNASEIFRAYNGPHAEETAEAREKLARECLSPGSEGLLDDEAVQPERGKD